MALDDAPRDREPEARAPVLGAAVNAREHLEHPLGVARIDPDAVVGDRERSGPVTTAL